MEIGLHHMRQFLAVADELHFGRAAARLCMAQPPLSQSLRRLEAALGVRLLDRSQRSVQLTPAGRVFADEARRTLAQADAAVTAARRAQADQLAQLRITFSTAALFRLLPAALRTFRARFSNWRIYLEEQPTDAQVERLRDGSIDIGLLHPPLKDATELVVRTVERDRILVAVPGASALAQASVVHLSELAEQDFVLFPREQGPHLHDRLTAACRRAGFAPRITLEPRRMHTVLSLVGAGMGVSLVGEGARSLRLDGVAFVPIADLPADLTWDLAIAWRARSTHPALQPFIDVVLGVGSSGSSSERSTPGARPAC